LSKKTKRIVEERIVERSTCFGFNLYASITVVFVIVNILVIFLVIVIIVVYVIVIILIVVVNVSGCERVDQEGAVGGHGQQEHEGDHPALRHRLHQVAATADRRYQQWKFGSR
jgi:hypothetical protein